MKNFFMIAILSVVTIVATAQTYAPSASSAIQSQQVLTTGSYNGTVYEPFSNVTPSEQSAVSPSYAPGPRKMGESGRNPGDVSTGSTQSPIGDAVLPLLLMALAYVGYMSLKKKQAQKA